MISFVVVGKYTICIDGKKHMQQSFSYNEVIGPYICCSILLSSRNKIKTFENIFIEFTVYGLLSYLRCYNGYYSTI